MERKSASCVVRRLAELPAAGMLTSDRILLADLVVSGRCCILLADPLRLTAVAASADAACVNSWLDWRPAASPPPLICCVYEDEYWMLAALLSISLTAAHEVPHLLMVLPGALSNWLSSPL